MRLIMIDIDIDDAARDEVLFAFQLAHPRPTPADVTEWVGRHPDLRAVIMEHAAALIEADLAGEIDVPLQENELARGRSVTLDLIHRFEQGVRTAAVTQGGATLVDLLQAAGKTLPVLAREIGAGRPMLTDYVSGSMSPPVEPRLTAAVSKALGLTVAAVEAAFATTLAKPVIARAKADGTPVVLRRSYDEIVRGDSTMTDERKAFWLQGI